MSNKLLLLAILIPACIDSPDSVDASPPLDTAERHPDGRESADATVDSRPSVDAENLKPCAVACPGEEIWPESGPYPHMVCLPSYTFCESQPSCSVCPVGSTVTCDGNQCLCEGVYCYGS